MAGLRERVARAVAPEYDAELVALREETAELRSAARTLGNKAAAFDVVL